MEEVQRLNASREFSVLDVTFTAAPELGLRPKCDLVATGGAPSAELSGREGKVPAQ